MPTINIMRQSSLLHPSLGFCVFIDRRFLLNDPISKQQHRHNMGIRGERKQVNTISSSALFDDLSGGERNSDECMESKQQQDPSFYELMSPINTAKPDQMSASSLAYLGDVVFELFIRSRYVWPSRRMSDLQNKVVSVVRGKYHWHIFIIPHMFIIHIHIYLYAIILCHSFLLLLWMQIQSSALYWHIITHCALVHSWSSIFAITKVRNCIETLIIFQFIHTKYFRFLNSFGSALYIWI